MHEWWCRITNVKNIGIGRLVTQKFYVKNMHLVDYLILCILNYIQVIHIF